MIPQRCWKIRKLAQTPIVLEVKIEQRQYKRKKLFGKELLIMQCRKCKLILHRSYLHADGLRFGENIPNVSLNKLQRVDIKTSNHWIDISCGQCGNKIGSLNKQNMISIISQSVAMQIVQGQLKDDGLICRRQPFDIIGAFNGLSYRHTMQEIYRLVYIKQQRYQLLFRSLRNRLKKFEMYLRGLNNLIIMTEGDKQKNIKYEHNKFQFDKIMRSTTVQQSNIHLNMRVQQKKRRDSSLYQSIRN